jgi:hypothetical protein
MKPLLWPWHRPELQQGLCAWYGRRESNPRLELGRLSRYHYATPARKQILTGQAQFVKFHSKFGRLLMLYAVHVTRRKGLSWNVNRTSSSEDGMSDENSGVDECFVITMPCRYRSTAESAPPLGRHRARHTDDCLFYIPHIEDKRYARECLGAPPSCASIRGEKACHKYCNFTTIVINHHELITCRSSATSILTW